LEIYLSEADSLTVTTVAALTVNLGSALRANFNSTVNSVARTRTASSLEDLNSKTDSPIKLVSLNGSLTIEGGADSQGVSAGGNGDVLLEARGAGGDIIIDADVISGTGHITFDAANDLAVNAAVTTAGAGVVYLLSGNDASVSGSLNNDNGDLLVDVARNLEQTGVIQSVSGDVGLMVGNDLTQGASSAVNAGGNLLVESGNDWTMADGSVMTVGGSQLVGISGGMITLGRITMSNIAANHVGLIAVGDILDGNAADANIEESNASAETLVSLRAGGEIGSTLGADAGSNVDVLDLAIDRLAAESSFGIHLKQLASGTDLVIGQVAGQTVDVAGVLRSQFNGAVVAVPSESRSVLALEDLVTTDNGEIELVVDGGDLKFLDGADADGPDLKADPEAVASGAMGRIDLRASGVIELENNVQFHADKVTAEYPDPTTRPMPGGAGPSLKSRAIHLQADSVVLGTDVELFTGVDQGTARIFAPRPIEYTVNDDGDTVPVSGVFPVDSAFYDASTVSTSELVQVDSRNLVGSLFVDVGNAGERGLTLDIDWGAANQRYQQLNGLSGDLNVLAGVNGSGQPTTPVTSVGTGEITLEHFYTDLDLLFSRANGRETVTDPLIVRFAVRHHESIFVQAGLVEQDLAAAEVVTGGIVSSTDNPATSPGSTLGLESGHHRFIIPNVPDFSVPVLPQREVIPTIEAVTFLPAIELDSVALETEVTSATASGVVSAARDDYFQLRVLRPDQNAEPLGVFRLGDDIMTGDKLQQLQRSLPDGRYEIEYVIGDTFSRVVLRFDVRNGEPVIPEDVLDEGELLLEEIPEQNELSPAEGKPVLKGEQRQGDEQDAKVDDQTLLEIQPNNSVEPILNMSLDQLGLTSWEPMSETVVMVPSSAVPPTSRVTGEFSVNGPLTEQLPLPVTTDAEHHSEQLQEESDADDSSLQAVSAGVVLTTALQRRRQKSERKKLSRSARFAARRESVENLHDSMSI
ncbi:hemagglutinin repeat-containing protein, partial [Rubripirellula sp.]